MQQTLHSLFALENRFPAQQLSQNTAYRPNIDYRSAPLRAKNPNNALAVVYRLFESITSGALYHLVATSGISKIRMVLIICKTHTLSA